jgi:hypothetical protein
VLRRIVTVTLLREIAALRHETRHLRWKPPAGNVKSTSALFARPAKPDDCGVLVGGEIERISGHLVPGDDSRLTWFVVAYSDGDEEYREGTLLDASQLAAKAGLVIVPTRAGYFQWVRDPIRGPEPWPTLPLTTP